MAVKRADSTWWKQPVYFKHPGFSRSLYTWIDGWISGGATCSTGLLVVYWVSELGGGGGSGRGKKQLRHVTCLVNRSVMTRGCAGEGLSLRSAAQAGENLSETWKYQWFGSCPHPPHLINRQGRSSFLLRLLVLSFFLALDPPKWQSNQNTFWTTQLWPQNGWRCQLFKF